MRRLFLCILVVVAMFSVGLAQQGGASQDTNEIPNMGRAPSQPNGLGRADVRVFDQNGNPVSGARVKLESTRTDGFFCESWNTTDARGVAVLPPLHMGRLRFIVEARGFQKVKMEVPASNLSEPIRVTLVRR